MLLSNDMRWLILLIGSVIFIFLTLTTLLAPNSPAQVTDFGHENVEFHQAYSDRVGQVLRLSRESEFPFRFLGRTISDENVARRYGHSVRKLPSVQSCLIGDEISNARPDLTEIDWSKIQSLEDANVCLFRIASSYGKIDSFQSWLEFNGFDVTSRFQRQNAEPMGNWIGISASRSHDENDGRLFSTGTFQNLLGQDHSLSVLAQFDQSENVVGIQITFNTK